MSIVMPTPTERGLIELRVTDFEHVLKPLFTQAVSTRDLRSYLITATPPRLEVANEWFGQGVYRRRGWSDRYAVIELDDHFLIIPEGECDTIWRQDKYGHKLHYALRHNHTLTFMGRDLIDGLTKLNEKYT